MKRRVEPAHASKHAATEDESCACGLWDGSAGGRLGAQSRNAAQEEDLPEEARRTGQGAELPLELRRAVVADETRHDAGPFGMVVERSGELFDGAREGTRIGVEQHDVVRGRGGEPAVDASGEAQVCAGMDDVDAGVMRGGG
jgi:hypothetical protein